MRDEIQIRDATVGEAPVIVEFNRLLALETEAKELEVEVLRRGVETILSDPALGRYFVAVADGRVVGQAMVTYEWSDWRNGMIWWFQSVYVEKDSRRRGVFRRLFHHVRDVAAAAPDVVGLRLYVERGNSVAREVYGRLGMVEPGYLVLERIPLDGRGRSG